MKLGERASLKKINIRWGVILLLLCIIIGLAVVRYYKEVYAMTPEQLMIARPEGVIRVLGRVKAGTLQANAEGATFEISSASGGETSIVVRHQGKPYENLREMKVLVIHGIWDTGKMELSAQKFSLVPNFHFVTAAYLLTLIPLGLFLFFMERSMIITSLQIKDERGYQPVLREGE